MPRFKQYKVTDKISVENFNEFLTFIESLANMKVTGGSFVINRAGASLDVSAPLGSRIHIVTLNSALSAGDLNTPTTATATPVFVSTINEEAPPTLAASTRRDIEVVNRSPDYTADKNDTILVVRVDLSDRFEWQPLLGKSTTPPTQEPDSGTGSCDCDHCAEGVIIPNTIECCKSFLAWTMNNPWQECLKTQLTLTYRQPDTWITEVFEGPRDSNGVFNEYRYLLRVNIIGKTTLELVLANDNGRNGVCLEYGKDSFQCQCDNVLTIKKPWGKINGIDRSKVSCNVCIQPHIVTPTYSPGTACGITFNSIPARWSLVPHSIVWDTVCSRCASSPIDLSGLTGLTIDFDFASVSYDQSGNITNLLWTTLFEIDGRTFWGKVSVNYFGSPCTCNSEVVVYCPSYPSTGYVLLRTTGISGTTYMLDCAQLTENGQQYVLNAGECVLTGGYYTLETDPASVVGPDNPLTPTAPTDSGACGSECVAPAAPANSDGYCCVNDVGLIMGMCLNYVSEDFCNALGGGAAWHAEGDCSGQDCVV